MKKLLLFVLTILLASCEDKFDKEKFNAQFTVKNSTNETVNLYIHETDERIKWEKTLAPSEVFMVTFNIKKDIKTSEGGFIFKATFLNGQSIEENSGYYSNYQMGGQRSHYYIISKESIDISKNN